MASQERGVYLMVLIGRIAVLRERSLVGQCLVVLVYTLAKYRERALDSHFSSYILQQQRGSFDCPVLSRSGERSSGFDPSRVYLAVPRAQLGSNCFPASRL